MTPTLLPNLAAVANCTTTWLLIPKPYGPVAIPVTTCYSMIWPAPP